MMGINGPIEWILIASLGYGALNAGVFAYREIKFALWKRKIKKEMDEFLDAMEKFTEVCEIIAAEITQAKETGKEPYIAPKLKQEFDTLMKQILSSKLKQKLVNALKEETPSDEQNSVQKRR